MTTDAPEPDRLDGFSTGARRALTLAEREARALGHGRVGTEHLLLGLVGEEDGAAAAVLVEAGADTASVRRKVQEAVGPGQSSETEPTESPRAARAIGRAPRFARDAGSRAVGSEHLLLAVLDVEGTAGQVLRGLGVDVEHLRAALGAGGPARGDQAAHEAASAPPPEPPRCPSCRAALGGGLHATTLPVAATDEVWEVVAVSCPACGAVLGIR